MDYEVVEEIYHVANKPNKRVKIQKILEKPSCKIIGTRKIEIWKCHSCGNVNENNGFFCEKCGTRNLATYG